MNDGSVIDPAALERLRDWGGGKLMAQMVRLFLENSPARMEQIRAGLEGGEVGLAEKGAHSLKSSAANVGALAVRDLAAAMEAVAARGDLGQARDDLADLEAAYSAACNALQDIIEGTDVTGE